MTSWLSIDANSDFSMYNFPLGIIKTANGKARAATRLGDFAVDLAYLFDAGFLKKANFSFTENLFDREVLNDFIASGKLNRVSLRNALIALFSESDTSLKNNEEAKKAALIPISQVQNLLPVFVPNYTDFYSSEEHATNVGKMFRPDQAPLLPNWKYLPVGYHGRASSIVVSGTNIYRPKGQTMPDGAAKPIFGPSKLMDFELEMAFIIGKESELGSHITTEEAEEYMVGMLIFNDWSARDIQKWEYVPLGPFLGKNFGSSVSPWIVTMEALEMFKVEGVKQEPEVHDYLKYTGKKSYDINLEVYLQPENGEETLICESNHKYLYWTMVQQLAHHTINGCNVKVGDMYASGTISGKAENSFGSMLELSWKGTRSIKLKDGSERKFIEDNDTIIMKAFCVKDGIRVGFGEVRSKILPAK